MEEMKNNIHEILRNLYCLTKEEISDFSVEWLIEIEKSGREVTQDVRNLIDNIIGCALSHK